MSSTFPHLLATRTFKFTLFLYHLFPLHMPITLFLMDAPFGRFHTGSSMLDLDGNLAWFVMEVVSPITFISTCLYSGISVHQLSSTNQIGAAAFLLHYLNRAIISPLILAPKRSPQHLMVTVSSIAFNLMNGYLQATYIMSNPASSRWYWLGMAGWALGLAANIYHDELLHDLRRPSRLLAPLGLSKYEQREKEAGKYKVPKGGLFHWIAFPNYSVEWFEWTCWSIAICTSPFLRISTTSSNAGNLRSVLPISLLQHLPTFLLNIKIPALLLTPPFTFVLAEITSMLPRALRGVRWYENKFGDEWVKSGRKGGRWVVVPGII